MFLRAILVAMLLFGVVTTSLWSVESVGGASMADVKVDITGLQKASENLGYIMSLMRSPRLLRKASERLRDILKGRIQNKGPYIVDKVFAPNAPATVWKKGGTYPYVDSGELLEQLVAKKTSTGYFVGVEGSQAYAASVLEFGAQIQVTDRMRRWWAVNFEIPLGATTTKIIIPPRRLFRDVAESQEVKNELAKLISRKLRGLV